MAEEITAGHINEYLANRDDFDLELTALRTFHEQGWRASLGGLYTDPVQQKHRQYDLRAHGVIWRDHHCEIRAATECKNLTPEFPLAISRVPCPREESPHAVIRTWLRGEIGDFTFEVLESDPTRLQLCPVGSPIGKSLTQIRLDGNKKAVGTDSET